jgi:hypothetical protein
VGFRSEHRPSRPLRAAAYRAGLRYEWLSMVYWLVKLSQRECSGRALATWRQGLIGGHPTQSY